MTAPTEPVEGGGKRRLSRPQIMALAGAVAVLLLVLIVVAVTRDGGSSDNAKSNRAAASDSARSGTDTNATSSGDSSGSVTSDPASTTAPVDPNLPTAAAPGGTTVPGNGPTGGTTPPVAPPSSSRVDSPNTTSPNQDPNAPRPPIGVQGPLQSNPCAFTGPPAVPSSVNDGPSPVGQWRTVASAQGNCGGDFGQVTLTAPSARIVYRSDAQQMLIFLVNVNEPDNNAGYADVDCRAVCADQGDLRSLSPGTYQIHVDATNGPWVLEIQEFR